METTQRHESSTATIERPRVEIRHLSKTFPGMRALNDVSLDLGAGEIHGLVGGNGSGKSTLIKILTGVYQGDPGGSLRTGDLELAAHHSSPEHARAAGIHVVHQDLGVFIDMSVAENIALGHGYPTVMKAQVRWSTQRQRTRRLLERFEIDAHPNTPLRSLSQAVRTQVAIARALQDQEEDSEGLLILDEPTSSLPAHEVQLLASTLRRYAERGQAILYVSHHLQEVLDLADRITVLRDGTKVATLESKALDEQELITLIVGREVRRVETNALQNAGGSALLELRNVSAGPLTDVSLTVAPGEVVGIGGLLGSGRTELLRTIFGDLPRHAGEIVFGEKTLSAAEPATAIAAGIAYVPENRSVDAAFMDLSVCTNVTMANIKDYWSIGRIAYRRMRSDARRLMSTFLVKASSGEAPLATLSGGNQQKVIIARWLRRKPKLLLLDEPTQGVDVGARAEIHALLRNAVADGSSALLVASDFEELAQVSDRVVVLSAGRVTGELRRPNLTAEQLMLAVQQSTGVTHGG